MLAACKRHKISPTITIVVVGKFVDIYRELKICSYDALGKRHHQLFFPTHGGEDKSGNCPAGTVVDDV
jgi:eukaryotic translation initiation factor 2C